MSQFVLVDCNNFFVSCERLFNPHLENKPVIVLSNNDGCVIARSNEAKKLGVAMGVPLFTIRDLITRHRVLVYSANFSLYGNISDRIMQLLSSWAPEMEIYSIDEAFLRLSADEEYAGSLRKTIRQWIGIPVSLGIAPTKTLAKVAGHLAKKAPEGVIDLSTPARQEAVLATLPLEDIWGIGNKSALHLKRFGLYTAQHLREANPVWLRKTMGIVFERIQQELLGVSVTSIEEERPAESITCSRSFGYRVTEETALSQALATYAATAARKLRRQKSVARALYVYLIDHERQSYGQMVSLPLPTNSTPDIITAALSAIPQLYRPGLSYKKCGLTLCDLSDERVYQTDLFLAAPSPKKRRLAKVLDAINEKFGKNSLFYGAMGIKREWQMRSEKRSPAYTSCWEELVIVKA